MNIAGIELFAGAGGLGLGAAAAGVDVRVLVENDAFACETLRSNRKWTRATVLEKDIRELSGHSLRKASGLGRGDPLVILGGPPCQPFSKAAYWTEAGAEARFRRARARGETIQKPPAPTRVQPDERRSLIDEFFRIVAESRADGFLLENVPSILHPRNKPIVARFVAEAEEAGFSTIVVPANAVDFGVAQRRRRVFILGAKRSRPLPPKPTHALNGHAVGKRRPAINAGDVLESFSGDEFSEPEEIVSGRWAEHLRTVPPGGNYKAHTAWGGHPSPTFVTETRFWHFLLKLSPELPSWTLSATPGPWTGPFHWDSRRLRTPELAALQGFSKSYRFAGNRRERVRQIGNAVPPQLARRMVGQLLRAVLDANPSRSRP